MKRYIIIDQKTGKTLKSGLFWFCKFQVRKMKRNGEQVVIKNGGRYI